MNAEFATKMAGCGSHAERAGRFCDELKEDGFSPPDAIAVAIMASGLLCLLGKLDEVSVSEIEDRAVTQFRKVIRVLHKAMEASLPGR